jgi:hypothetical protein
MNLYVLVEGNKTEKKVYESWLGYLFPEHESVERLEDVDQAHIFFRRGGGYPHYLQMIEAALEDIEQHGNFDHLLICADAEEDDPEVKRRELDRKIEKGPHFHAVTTIVHNCCIETWFLGHQKVFPRNPEGDFQDYLEFYNVCEDDPERMPKPEDYITTAGFHEEYLDAMFHEKEGLNGYNKRRPGIVRNDSYLMELKRRRADTDHLDSFGTFVEWANEFDVNWPS